MTEFSNYQFYDKSTKEKWGYTDSAKNNASDSSAEKLPDNKDLVKQVFNQFVKDNPSFYGVKTKKEISYQIKEIKTFDTNAASVKEKTVEVKIGNSTFLIFTKGSQISVSLIDQTSLFKDLSSFWLLTQRLFYRMKIPFKKEMSNKKIIQKGLKELEESLKKGTDFLGPESQAKIKGDKLVENIKTTRQSLKNNDFEKNLYNWVEQIEQIREGNSGSFVSGYILEPYRTFQPILIEFSMNKGELHLKLYHDSIEATKGFYTNAFIFNAKPSREELIKIIQIVVDPIKIQQEWKSEFKKLQKSLSSSTLEKLPKEHETSKEFVNMVSYIQALMNDKISFQEQNQKKASPIAIPGQRVLKMFDYLEEKDITNEKRGAILTKMTLDWAKRKMIEAQTKEDFISLKDTIAHLETKLAKAMYGDEALIETKHLERQSPLFSKLHAIQKKCDEHIEHLKEKKSEKIEIFRNEATSKNLKTQLKIPIVMKPPPPTVDMAPASASINASPLITQPTWNDYLKDIEKAANKENQIDIETIKTKLSSKEIPQETIANLSSENPEVSSKALEEIYEKLDLQECFKDTLAFQQEKKIRLSELKELPKSNLIMCLIHRNISLKTSCTEEQIKQVPEGSLKTKQATAIVETLIKNLESDDLEEVIKAAKDLLNILSEIKKKPFNTNEMSFDDENSMISGTLLNSIIPQSNDFYKVKTQSLEALLSYLTLVHQGTFKDMLVKSVFCPQLCPINPHPYKTPKEGVEAEIIDEDYSYANFCVQIEKLSSPLLLSKEKNKELNENLNLFISLRPLINSEAKKQLITKTLKENNLSIEKQKEILSSIDPIEASIKKNENSPPSECGIEKRDYSA